MSKRNLPKTSVSMRGVSFVEFSLVGSISFFLIFAILDFSFFLYRSDKIWEVVHRTGEDAALQMTGFTAASSCEVQAEATFNTRYSAENWLNRVRLGSASTTFALTDVASVTQQSTTVAIDTTWIIPPNPNPVPAEVTIPVRGIEMRAQVTIPCYFTCTFFGGSAGGMLWDRKMFFAFKDQGACP